MRQSSNSDKELTFSLVTSKGFWTPWSFDLINQIIWNPRASVQTKSGKETKKVKDKTKSGGPITSPKIDDPVISKKETTAHDEYFCDLEIPILPRKYLEAIITWKRPHEFFADVPPEDLVEKVFVFSGKPYELHSLNEHLEYCSYYNHILDAFESLRLYDDFEKLDFDEFGFTEWKPTNNIYAIGRVEKGRPHEVQYNPYGKYVVRLYHCGKWRQIQVDDRIPVNYQNKPLIPSICTEERLEIWPVLITKAILKLNLVRLYDDGHYYLDQRATHQCRMYDGVKCRCKDIIAVRKHYLFNESDIIRFNVIHLLTGWYPDEYEFSGKRSERIWDVVQKLLPSFQYSMLPPLAPPTPHPKATEKVKGSKQRAVQSLVSANSWMDNFRREPISLVTLDTMLGPNLLTNKRLFMEINCLLIRDIPLEETGEVTRALPIWKTYRWMYWAVEKGIWKPEDTKIFWSLFCSIPECRQHYFKHLFEHEWESKVYQKKNNIEGNNARISAGEQKKGSVKRKKSEDVKKRKSEGVVPTTQGKSNTNVWIDFNKLLSALECIKQYLKDHQFATNIFISNEDPPPKIPLAPAPKTSIGKSISKSPPIKPPKKGKAPTAVTVANISDEPENQPASIQRVYGDEKTYLYMFVDHEDCHDAVIDLTVLKDERNMVEAKVKIEKYRWNCLKHVVATEIASTCMDGCKICLPKGRTVYRILCRTKNFCLHIRSTSPNVKISNNDAMFDLMAKDGIRYESYIRNIIKCMKLYLESIGDPDFVDNMSAFFASIMEYSRAIYTGIPEVHAYVFQQLRYSLFDLTRNDMDSRRTIRRIILSPDTAWSCYPLRCTLGKEFLQAAKVLRAIDKYKCDCPAEPLIYTPEQEDQIRNCAALKIQSFMKMVYIQKLLRYHDKTEPNRKYNDQLKKDIAVLLEKFCSEQAQVFKDFFLFFLFNGTFKNLPLDRLLVPFDTNMRFAELYDFFDDFHYTVRKWTKTYEIPFAAQGGQWYPLKIGCLFCHSEKARRIMLRVKPTNTYSKFQYFLTILNNDDFKLMPMSDLDDIWSLVQNKLGYKVFIYTYIPVEDEGGAQPPNVAWSLEMVSPRHAPLVHFCNYCNDTLCPCDQPAIPVINFPLQCEEAELRDFDFYSETHECSPKDMLLAKYQIKTYEMICLSIFMSGSSDLYEFEIKVIQVHARYVVASETGTGRVSMVGLYLKPMSGNWPYHKSTDFHVTLNAVRRIRAGSQVSRRTSDSSLKSGKLTTDHSNTRVISGTSTVSDQFTWNVKFAYDKGAPLEIERLDNQN